MGDNGSDFREILGRCMEQINTDVWRRAFLAGFGFLPMLALLPIYNIYMPVILQAGHPLWEGTARVASGEITGFALSPVWAYFIMTWDNIAGILLAVWVGRRSDGMRRRKPWIIAGVALAALSFALLPWFANLTPFLLLVGCFSVGLALLRAPALAWLGDLFAATERGRANGMFNLLRGAVTVMALMGAAWIFRSGGLGLLFTAAAAVALSFALIAALSVEEIPKQNRDKTMGVIELLKQPLIVAFLWVVMMLFIVFQGLMVSLSAFAVFELKIGMVLVPVAMALFALIRACCAIPFGILGEHWGRERVIALALFLFALLNIAAYFVVHSLPGFLLYLALAAPLLSMTIVNFLPLIFDLNEDRCHGTCTGLYVMVIQIGAIIGPLGFGWLVEITGSNRTILLASAACCLLGLIASAWLMVIRQGKCMRESYR